MGEVERARAAGAEEEEEGEEELDPPKMLICLVGPPQAGKHSLAQHLVAHHTFTRVHLDPLSSPSPSSTNSPTSLSFSSTSDFLDHATRTWRVDYVTTALTSRQKLVEFAKRPFVAIVHVDAPLGVRFKRAVARCALLSRESRVGQEADTVWMRARRARQEGRTPPSLDEFVEQDDLLYHGSLPLEPSIAAPPPPPRAPDGDAPDTLHATPTKPRLVDSPPSPTPSPARLVLTPNPSPELYRSSTSSLPAAAAATPAPAPTPSATPPDTLLSSTLPLASLVLPNPYPSLPLVLSSLSSFLPSLTEALRPSWDTYFMLLAHLASLRSNCMKRRVGAVLVRDKRVVSTGYNGTPRGVTNCGEGGCARCNSHGDGWALAAPSASSSSSSSAAGAAAAAAGGGGRAPRAAPPLNRVGEALDECLCLHAEENALLEAGRERVSGGGTLGAVLYCNTCVGPLALSRCLAMVRARARKSPWGMVADARSSSSFLSFPLSSRSLSFALFPPYASIPLSTLSSTSRSRRRPRPALSFLSCPACPPRLALLDSLAVLNRRHRPTLAPTSPHPTRLPPPTAHRPPVHPHSCPCLRCTVKIVQCGVREVVYSLSYSMDAASRRVMSEAGVGLRQMVMPPFPR